jgi:hypothetical protein
MSPNPSRASTAGQVFNDLRNLARRQGRSTDELLIFYVLERFLFRVSRSPYADRLILKGGLLLAAFDARRSTRDADLLASHLSQDETQVVAWVSEIASAEIDDGVIFQTDRARSRSIRETDQYAGVRISMPSQIGKANASVSLDINFGDPVTPGATPTAYPQLLDPATFTLLSYPVQTLIAEKLTTLVALGDLNTRDRDWADIWRLLGTQDLGGREMLDAVLNTSTYRGVALRPLSHAVTRLPTLRQGAYTAWRRRQTADAAFYPEDFAELVEDVIRFADPLLDSRAADQTWRANKRRWRSS